MTASCLRFCPIARVISFAAVLVIDVFAVADPANHNNASLDIKQDSVIPHPQPICCLCFAQTLDVAMQTALQSLDLAQNLRALLRRELIQLLKCCFAEFPWRCLFRMGLPSACSWQYAILNRFSRK